MKPTNFQDSNCESKSSNCVIWSGPDIECIDLKNGQSVSWAIFTLATNFCELKSQFDISQYDLTAMTAEFGPVTDIKTLISNLITKVYSS